MSFISTYSTQFIHRLDYGLEMIFNRLSCLLEDESVLSYLFVLYPWTEWQLHLDIFFFLQIYLYYA